jgi:hypothetical protein
MLLVDKNFKRRKIMERKIHIERKEEIDGTYIQSILQKKDLLEELIPTLETREEVEYALALEIVYRWTH